MAVSWGKPYEPNSVIKNDIEFILMERKPGGYRSPSLETRVLSVISAEEHKTWFQQIWSGVTGASTRNHPAPYPVDLAERLVRMFSFVGDTVLDPFMGTGTTSTAAGLWGRNSIGVEVDPEYFRMSEQRIRKDLSRHGSALVMTHAPIESTAGRTTCLTLEKNSVKPSVSSGMSGRVSRKGKAGTAGKKTPGAGRP